MESNRKDNRSGTGIPFGRRSTRRQEEAHPRNDDRVELANEKDRRHKIASIHNNGDVCKRSSQWKVWDKRDKTSHKTKSPSMRTTFFVEDLSYLYSDKKPKYDRMWKYNAGLGHTWEDDSDRKTRVRDGATRNIGDAILQSCRVPSMERSEALDRVHRANLNAFNSHYEGALGAYIGFALLELYDSPREAHGSDLAERAPEVVPELDADTVEGLIDYVFRKYGDQS